MPIFFSPWVWAGARSCRGANAACRHCSSLPASLFTAAVVVFPTLFGIWIAFTNWNLASLTGREFNGIDNLVQLFSDTYYGNALLNTVYYVIAVLFEYAIAFGLALLLNADIRGRRFFPRRLPDALHAEPRLR